MINKVKIGERIISNTHKPLVIAEISANHQNSINKTIKLLKKAADAKVEAVKFQTFEINEMTINVNRKEFLIKEKFKNSKWNSRSLYSIYKKPNFPLNGIKEYLKLQDL